MKYNKFLYNFNINAFYLAYKIKDDIRIYFHINKKLD